MQKDQNLNTSHVKVNHEADSICAQYFANLNTSHVKVNQGYS
ncbi:hypothetical protein [uncultured Clostridium sp.]